MSSTTAGPESGPYGRAGGRGAPYGIHPGRQACSLWAPVSSAPIGWGRIAARRLPAVSVAGKFVDKILS